MGFFVVVVPSVVDRHSERTLPAPQDITVAPLSDTSIVVRWRPPKFDRVMDRYTIRYRPVLRDMDIDKNNADIKMLVR